jgi:hypothetical protein
MSKLTNHLVGQLIVRPLLARSLPLDSMTHPRSMKHEATLDTAFDAIATRGYWSPFDEMPSSKVYGETANPDGDAAFKAHLNRTFEPDHSPPAGQALMMAFQAGKPACAGPGTRSERICLAAASSNSRAGLLGKAARQEPMTPAQSRGELRLVRRGLRFEPVPRDSKQSPCCAEVHARKSRPNGIGARPWRHRPFGRMESRARRG